jgi:AcrR family transcriptional regulator
MARPRTDIRPRIVAVARERFADAGVDATSLRSIASDAGTSIGMIYYYFPTKDELFLAVVEDVYGQLLADVEQALGRERDFGQAVLALYRRIAAAAPVERQVIRLVAREAFNSGERLERLAQRFSRGHVALVFQTVTSGVESGDLRTDLHPLVLMAATIALGTLPQIAIRTLGKHLPVAAPSSEELTRQLTAALLEGIAKR